MDRALEDVLAEAAPFLPAGEILSDFEAGRCLRPSGNLVSRRVRAKLFDVDVSDF